MSAKLDTRGCAEAMLDLRLRRLPRRARVDRDVPGQRLGLASLHPRRTMPAHPRRATVGLLATLRLWAPLVLPPPRSPQAAAAATTSRRRATGRATSARRSPSGRVAQRPPPTSLRSGPPPRTSRRPSTTSRPRRTRSPTTCEGSARRTPRRATRRRSRSTRSRTTSTASSTRSRARSTTSPARATSLSAVSAVTAGLVAMGSRSATAFTALGELDAEGELEDAFREAESCDEPDRDS